MEIPFKTLSDNARIWIYPSNRKLSDNEVIEIKELCSDFLAKWTSHNNTLLASFDIPYNRFIVFGLEVDFNSPSGCSIDSSVHFIQFLENKFNISLLDKMNVTFKQGQFLTHKTLNDFKSMVKNGSVNSETIVFNNLVNDMAGYRSEWEIQMKDSWHSRFIK
tara:strand:- start:676 stop:1161 length:486 start_codon:yes stop_codon:yes gene_type:complete